MKLGDSYSINNGYELRWMTKNVLFKLRNELAENPFLHINDIRPNDFFSEDEREKINDLGRHLFQDRFEIYIGVFDQGNNLVGWSYGWQTDQMTYYMCNSAILSKHRRNGLYRELLRVNLDILTSKGFQLIYSRHTATNNSVIIPKLKAGFVIGGIEIDDVFGTMVILKYFSNEKRRRVMDFRVGELKELGN